MENFLLLHDRTLNTHAPSFTSELTQAKDSLSCPTPALQTHSRDIGPGALGAGEKGDFLVFTSLGAPPNTSVPSTLQTIWTVGSASYQVSLISKQVSLRQLSHHK